MRKIKKENYLATKFYVEENEENMSKTAVAKIFNADRHMITDLENKYLNLVEPSEEDGYMYLFTERELNAVNEYINNPNLFKADIRKKYKIGNSATFNNWLKILGYSTDRRYIYNFNRDKFKEEITAEHAYWLGFLLADGCVTGRSSTDDPYIIQLTLGDKDKEHVYKFAKFLEYPENQLKKVIKSKIGGAYTKDNVCWSIDVCSREMCKDVAKYNLVPRKTLHEKPYIFKDRELELNYIRGIIDGDGWISRPDNPQKRLGVVGSKEVCEYVSSVLKEYTNQHSSKVKPKQESKQEPDTFLYYWEIANRQGVLDICKILYPENAKIFLERKFNNSRAV